MSSSSLSSRTSSQLTPPSQASANQDGVGEDHLGVVIPPHIVVSEDAGPDTTWATPEVVNPAWVPFTPPPAFPTTEATFVSTGGSPAAVGSTADSMLSASLSGSYGRTTPASTTLEDTEKDTIAERGHESPQVVSEIQNSAFPLASGPALLALHQQRPNPASRRGFFRNSVSNLRESLTSSWVSDPDWAPSLSLGSVRSSQRARAAEKKARETELLFERLQLESRMGLSAAEAELRVMQLRHETLKANQLAGPRSAGGLFKESCSTDLLFLLDATGSMYPYIDAAKQQIRSIVDDINRTFFNEADVRVAVVAYRDHNDKKRIEFLDFTSDVAEVFKFLDAVEAGGGDDLAEDVLGGLDTALNASWVHQTRCIMHIADSPAHGRELHDMGSHSDFYIDTIVTPEPHGLKHGPLLEKMIDLKVNYIFFRINPGTDKMTFVFLKAYAKAAPNARLHAENKYHVHAADWVKRLRAHAGDDDSTISVASSATANSFVKVRRKTQSEDDGGLHFDEVKLGTAYSSLQHLVVNSVTASTSRTAVRLSSSASSNRSSFARSKLAHKSKLANLVEDDETQVIEEADEHKAEVQEWEVVDKSEKELEPAPEAQKESCSDKEIEFETGEPQFHNSRWFDQTIRVKAFSPDLVDIRPGGKGKTAADRAGSLLDHMIESDDNIRISTNELTILKRSKPFAEGALRVASYARTQESTNALVVKSFKKGGKTLAHLAEDMRVQALCKVFAMEFKSLTAEEGHSLDFIIATCLQPLGSGDEPQECLALEPLIRGHETYRKYNNNCGGVDKIHSVFGEEAQAFSHFTFERSQGQLLAVDLQGVSNVLTDPAIHTKDRSRFVLSDTNLNEDGFKLFFASHRCNRICKLLELQSDASMFISGDFKFRTDWFAVDETQSSEKTPPNPSVGLPVMVCCSNKLCSKIVAKSTARTTPPDFCWCDQCWPQLSSSVVKRVCATPGAYHEFDVSKFFFESQGQILPQTCEEHGGVPSLPVPVPGRSRGGFSSFFGIGRSKK